MFKLKLRMLRKSTLFKFKLVFLAIPLLLRQRFAFASAVRSALRASQVALPQCFPGRGAWDQVVVIDSSWMCLTWHFMQIMFDETAASNYISF